MRFVFVILLFSAISLSGSAAISNGNDFTVPEVDANYFEGTLHYLLDINGMEQEFRYRIKDSFIRLEIDDPHMGGSMTLLFAQNHDRMVALLHEVSGYSEIAFKEVADRSEILLNRLDRVVATGNEQEISGILSREYEIQTEKEESIVLWSPIESNRYGYFQFPDFGNPELVHILKHDVPAGFFPFMVFYEGERHTINVTLIDVVEETLDPKIFEVPANYRNIPVTVPDY